MKREKRNQFRWVAVAGLLWGLAACSPEETGGPALPVEEPEETTPEETAEAAEPIEITADDDMRFGRTAFEVEPGAEVTVLLKNVGSLPKETMGHNFVLLAMGTDTTAFASAAIPHEENAFIPPDRADEVIAASGVLGPGEEEEITFTAPERAGDYDYICSFPGHTAAGMVGVMTVRTEDEDTPGEADEEPPEEEPEERPDETEEEADPPADGPDA